MGMPCRLAMQKLLMYATSLPLEITQLHVMHRAGSPTS